MNKKNIFINNILLLLSLFFFKGFGQQATYIFPPTPSPLLPQYIAREYIKLQPGFSFAANTNSTFTAKVDDGFICGLPISQETQPTSLRTFDLNKPVGSINGEYGVNDLGAAVYSIPLTIAPGSADFVPTLKIEYSSMSGDGLFGSGWSLSGFSSITRVAKTMYYDNKTERVLFDNTDHFALDGQILIPINGTNGADGTEYRTENESFTKIISYGTVGSGPEKFKVWTKDGKIIEYGYTPNSKQEIAGISSVISWGISSISDHNSNYINYIYNKDASNGRVWPVKIEYTGNTNANILPYNSIELIYDLLPQERVSYVNGYKFVKNLIVKEIKVKNENNLLYKYVFNYSTYTYSTINLNSFSNGSVLLNEILLYNKEGISYNSTAFNYSTAGGDNYTYANNLSNFSVDQGWDNTNHVRCMADVNGDGRADIVGFGGQNVIVSLANGNGFNDATVWYSDGFCINSGGWDIVKHPRKLVDVNGDGLADIVGFASAGVYVALSTGSGFAPMTQWVGGFGYDNGWTNQGDFPRFIVDVTGDKLPDIVGFSSDGVVVAKNDGNNHFVVQPIWASGFGTAQGYDYTKHIRQVADMNGDGMADIISFAEDQILVGLSTGNSFSVSTWLSGSFCHGQNAGGWDIINNPRYVVDVNGDGLADIVGFAGVGVWVSLSNGKDHFLTPTSWRNNNFADEYGTLSERQIADINGDGLPDLVGFGGSVQFSLNTGNSFETIQRSAIGGNQLAVSYLRLFADINGDGRADLVCFKQSYVKSDLSAVDHNRKLIKATNGLNFSIEFTYKPMIDVTSVYQYSGLETFPYVKIACPLKLVESLKIDDGIGGYATTTYKYYDGIMHLWGKGFMGFMSVVTNGTGMHTNKEFTLNHEFAIKNLTHTYTATYGTGSTTLAEIGMIYQVSGLGNKRVQNVMTTKNTHDYLTNTLTTDQYQYDSYGNLSNLTSTLKNFSTNTVLQTGTTTTQYAIAGSWCPTSPSSISTTNTITGKSPYTRIKNFEYYSNGNLKKEISDPGNPKSNTLTYDTYNSFGLPTKTTLSATGLPSVINQMEYDSKGRFCIKKTNPLNHFASFTYNTATGTVLSLIDANGLETKYEYDGFGNLKKTIYSDLTESTISTSFYVDNATCYYTTINQSGKAPILTYYDKLNRELKKITRNIINSQVIVATTYNAKGQVASKTVPYFSGNTPLLNTYTYDDLGRISSQACPDGTNMQVNYSFDIQSSLFSQTTITTKNGHSQQQINKYNQLGQLVQTIDNNGVAVYKDYFSSGLLEKSWVQGMNTNQYTTLTYDIQGNRTSIFDPNNGLSSSTYDAYGRMLTKVDAKNNSVSYTYDVIGRVLTRTQPEGTISYVYDTRTMGKGKLSSVTGWNGISDEYYFDSYGRDWKKNETIDGVVYTELLEYNTNGFLNKLTYPNGFAITYNYLNGQLRSVHNASDDSPIWSTTQQNEYGIYTSYTSGNNISTTKTYDSFGRLTDIQTGSIQNNHYVYDEFNNIKSREDIITNQKEVFGYDNLNRLTDIDLYQNSSFISNKSISYNNFGNIQSKYDAGDYQYGNPIKLNAVTSLTNNPGTITAPHAIQYTSFDKVSKITHSNGELMIDFVYGPDFARRKTYETDINAGQINTKIFALGNYEKYTDELGGDDFYNCYIYGGSELVAIYNQQYGQSRMLYVHKDHLGSIEKITNQSGTVVYNFSYDAWGNRRNPTNWTLTATNTDVLFARGYTGQEHLDKFGLINMNSRMYDPIVGCFLSPDSYVQDPSYSQSYNRYSYCLNNPLLYTDPSGNYALIDDVIAGVVGGVINLASNIYNGNIKGDFLTCIGKGAAAFGAGAVGGIGGLYPELGGWLWGGAVVGATNSWLSGGNGEDILMGAGIGMVSGLVGGAAGQWAGQSLGGLVVNGFNVTSPVLKGFIGGAIGGGVGGYAGGFSAGYIMTGDLDLANKAGLSGMRSGAAVGAAVGAGSAYRAAKDNNVNPLTGKPNKSLTIGEGMSSNTEKGWFGVKDIAKDLSSDFYDPEPQMMASMKVNGETLNFGTTDNGMYDNAIMIEMTMESQVPIFDRGPVGNNSQYYNMECGRTMNYNNLYQVKTFANYSLTIRILIIYK